MRKFDFTVHSFHGDENVTAYEPFEGASFVVHRSLTPSRNEWVVTHRRSTFIAHYPTRNTRKAALEIAEMLSKACPSAGKVKFIRAGSNSKLTGPYRKLRAEITECLGTDA